MRSLFRILLCVSLLSCLMAVDAYAEKTEEELNLHARAAVLMDADSGRVLYSKEAETPCAMASTTKVMTLLIALENDAADQRAEVSEYAASMPETRLGVIKGEKYRLEDLYYAMMLESCNDTAVVIAEAIAGSTEAFAELMNEKAVELGCTSAHFVTPNGLDAADEGGSHSCTAKDMALIMRYAIKNPDFLVITQTSDYTFSDLDNKRSFNVHNKNTLFDRMEGAISGKTGYTGEAGYCYVCAVEKGEKKFIITLLGCGWPPHKNYKWQDVAALVQYGDIHYELVNIDIKKYVKSSWVQVINGAEQKIELYPDQTKKHYLKKEEEKIDFSIMYPGQVEAPVDKDDSMGKIFLTIDGCEVGTVDYRAVQSVTRIGK